MARTDESTTKLPKVSYSINEFLQATGLGKTRFYREVQDGRLKVVKSGRRTLILAQDAEAWARIISAAA